MARHCGSLAKAPGANVASSNAASINFIELPVKTGARAAGLRAWSKPLRNQPALFLLVGAEGRLQSRNLLARRRSNGLYLLLFRLLRLAIAALFTFGHVDVSRVFRCSLIAVTRRRSASGKRRRIKGLSEKRWSGATREVAVSGPCALSRGIAIDLLELVGGITSQEAIAHAAMSSVHTLKLTSVFGPKVWVIGTSDASRLWAMRVRPIRGTLLVGSNVCQRPPI